MNRELPASPAAAPQGERNHRERRACRRVKLSQPVRVCPTDPRHGEEVRATLNVSRSGLYFTTTLQHYYIGMHLDLAFPYRVGEPVLRTIVGEIVRLERRTNGEWGVVVKLLLN